MRKLFDKLTFILSAFAIAFFAFGACSSGHSSDVGTRGTVNIDGSSTVFPITEAVAEQFQEENKGIYVVVGISGTGGGFERFCSGETHITNASRPIKRSEAEVCQSRGVEFIELPVAFDGLTVAVNKENNFADYLTMEELNHIWRAQNPARKWSEVRAGWPSEKIILFSPGADSGTFDYFTETVNGQSGNSRSENTSFSEDDNVLVVGIAGGRFSIGYFGFSYYINNADRLRAVPIDSGEGPVFPTQQTIESGKYSPLSRPLFIYVNIEALANPAVEQFVNFYLGDGRLLIDSPEVGYVRLPDEFYQVMRKRVEDRVVGSVLDDFSPTGKAFLERYR